MFCKIYYTKHFRNGHTASEAFYNFMSCKITEDGNGVEFKFGTTENLQCIVRALSDIEDIVIQTTNPMIF